MFIGIGFELVVMVLGGAYLGNMIDTHMGWNSVATALLVVMFMAAWFVHLLFLLSRFEKNNGEPKA